MKKTINNHFIQKAFARNFSNNNIIKWVRYSTNEEGSFNINKSIKQPIIKMKFYSQEIEDGMNKLESNGIKALQKVLFQANNNQEITLKRRDLIAIKYYYLLSAFRTNKSREDIKNLNGDSVYNEQVKRDGRNPKELQEHQIKIILESYNKNCKSLKENYSKKIYEKLISKMDKNKTNNHGYIIDFLQKNLDVETSMYFSIMNTINSRLIFFKFNKK